MFRSRIARQIRAVVLLGILLALLTVAAYYVEMIHPAHNLLSFYHDVQHNVSAVMHTAHND